MFLKYFYANQHDLVKQNRLGLAKPYVVRLCGRTTKRDFPNIVSPQSHLEISVQFFFVFFFFLLNYNEYIYIALILSPSGSRRFTLNNYPDRPSFVPKHSRLSGMYAVRVILKDASTLEFEQLFHCLISATQTRLGERGKMQ